VWLAAALRLVLDALARRFGGVCATNPCPGLLMLVHAVYFSLRADLPAAHHATFEAWLPKLCAIRSVLAGYPGIPADTDRAVIDRAYTHALVLLFDSAANEQAYQVDPVHDQFRVECQTFWERVRIFDSITPSPAPAG
jgi:Stress responsive A/B Barrel Domain